VELEVAFPPIVLAPLAGGPSTPELTAAVSNAGGLGFLAAGYLAPDVFAEQLRRTRALTNEQIGVNLFVLADVGVHDDAVAAYAHELEPEARARGVQLGEPRFDDDWLAEKLEVIVRADVQVVSTTFGCLASETIARLQQSGTRVWATVTAAHEARAARRDPARGAVRAPPAGCVGRSAEGDADQRGMRRPQ
jgi:nitronate monooxygenase